MTVYANVQRMPCLKKYSLALSSRTIMYCQWRGHLQEWVSDLKMENHGKFKLAEVFFIRCVSKHGWWSWKWCDAVSKLGEFC